MSTYQLYCTLNDLESDLGLHGGPEALLFAKLRAASQLLCMEVGEFLPVLATRVMKGNGKPGMSIPPLLDAALSITNDGTALSSSDYLLRPSGRLWPNGPYTWIDKASEAPTLSAWCAEEDGVSITDYFGLYNEARALGITMGAEMDASTTSMQVNDGSKVSPGLIALIGSELLAVLAVGSPTTSITTLSADLAVDADQATLASGAAVKIGEIVRRGIEKMKVLDINSNTVYLDRGWQGTPRSAHTSGQAIDVYRTFTVERGINGTTAASHANGVSVSQQVAPDDVNFLARKVTGRMLLDAQGGFKSRLDDNTGTATHLYILPHELNEVREHYRIFG